MVGISPDSGGRDKGIEKKSAGAAPGTSESLEGQRLSLPDAGHDAELPRLPENKESQPMPPAVRPPKKATAQDDAVDALDKTSKAFSREPSKAGMDQAVQENLTGSEKANKVLHRYKQITLHLLGLKKSRSVK